MKKVYLHVISLFAAVVIVLNGLPCNSAASPAANPDTMEVHFIDVGQGDATLITCGGHAMLIDAGDDTKGTAVQHYLNQQKIATLDYLILTHPDADHIGGAPVIITKFEIRQVFVSNFEKDNRTYEKLIQALDYRRLDAATPEAGAEYALGTAVMTVLAPNAEYDNPNDASIALLIQNGDNKFLFTGDAGAAAERDILDTGMDISADVYKVGHHGSRYSTSADFLEAAAPAYAVISCAQDNAYGYPHAEILNMLKAHGVKVYRTDEAGTVIAASDGKEITFQGPASETWKAGEIVDNAAAAEITYVLNTKTKKFHKPSCKGLPTANRKDVSESRESVIAQGYSPCQRCNP